MRAGLLRGSFVPPAQLRELRLISRQRQKLVGQLASEKNRLHKVLTDGGIRLGVVVSDLQGQSARTMFFMLKRREYYRDSTTDYEALSVQRNAPRWIKALTKFGFIPTAA